MLLALRALVLLAAVMPVFAATAFHPVWWQVLIAAAIGSGLGQLAARFARSRTVMAAVLAAAVAIIGGSVAWSFRHGAPAADASNGIVVVRGPLLTWEDVEQMHTLKSVHLAVPYLRRSMQTMSEDANWNTSVIGTTNDYLEIIGVELASGTAFLPGAGKVAILGDTVVKQLYGGRSRVGEQIRINSQPFQVVGVLAHRGTAQTGEDLDDVVLVPLEIYQQRIDGGIDRHLVHGAVLLEPEVRGDTARVELDLHRLLGDRHLGRDDELTIRTIPQ